MAASTITRDTWTNDTGTAAVPNADGTILQNSVLQNHIYARIDELFAGAGSYATLTLGGLLAVEGFGSHTFTAAGAALNQITIRNTSAGVAAGAELNLGNDGSATALLLLQTSTTYTAATDTPQDGTVIRCSRAGGLNISASNATGSIRFYQNSTLYGALTSGQFLFSSGAAAAPILSFTGDVNTGIYRIGADILGFSAGAFIAFWRGDLAGTLGPHLFVDHAAAGTGNMSGCGVLIGRNTSGSGAAGWLGMTEASGTIAYLWVDASGNLEISTGPPQEDGAPSDTSGTVVGTQTSLLESKELLDGAVSPADALALICATPITKFKYRSNAYNGSEFHGIVAEWSPAFAMNPSPEHPAGRAFNPVSAFGYTVQAIKALESRLAALEARG